MTQNAASETGDAGDVIEFLLAQHRQISSLLEKVLATTGDERQRYFQDVRGLLARHETAEEMIVRPLTRKAPQGDEVAEGRTAEEDHAKEVLGRLEKMPVDTPEFTAAFTQFRQRVLAHADAEETLEFPLLRQTNDHDALLQARSAVERAEQMDPTHAQPGATPSAADDVPGPFTALLDRARKAFGKTDS